MMRRILTLCALVALVATAANAVPVRQVKCTKQTGGGSTGDSLTAAADTSTALILPADVSAWWVVAAADSQARYYTEVSADGTYWYRIDTDSTGGASQAEASADFGVLYSGMYVRMILDPVPAGTSPYGASWIFFKQ